MQKQQITELEKYLYNKHLAASRSARNKPFRLKTNFDDVVDTEKHKFLKRISILFNKHPDINADVYFTAPYKLYPDVVFFGLDYFSSMRAIKSYTIYKKQLLLEDPDSQVVDVSDSLRFIANFCISESIHFHRYPFHKTADVYTWMLHYKQNKINVYSLFEFTDVHSSITELTQEIQDFFVHDFVEQFHNLKLKYNKSNKLKSYVRAAFPVLSNFVQKKLAETQKPSKI
jgi:hypothetical protein